MRLLQAGGAKRGREKIVARQKFLDERSLNAIASPLAVPAQRSTGRIAMAVKARDGTTVLDRLYQAGPLRARVVRPEPGQRTTVVLINTSGGIAAGDHLMVSVEAAPGTALTITGQGAERIYRANAGDRASHVETALSVAAGARLEYLPQETIIFDRAGLERSLRIDLAAGAEYLGVEALIFGRTAMGEQVREAHVLDKIALFRDGALVYRDALRLPRQTAAGLQTGATMGGAAALATIMFAAPDAASRLAGVRAALGEADAGATMRNGLLLVRILAQTGKALRAIVVLVLAVLREGRAMPRVWGC